MESPCGSKVLLEILIDYVVKRTCDGGDCFDLACSQHKRIQGKFEQMVCRALSDERQAGIAAWRSHCCASPGLDHIVACCCYKFIQERQRTKSREVLVGRGLLNAIKGLIIVNV